MPVILKQVKSKPIKIFVIFLLLTLTACTKNQDDVNLPVFDSIGGDFTLNSSLDRPLKLSDYQGKVVLINFGYTNCPDVCPMVLTRLVKLSNKLKENYAVDEKQLQIFFISVDPERDTPEYLKSYLSFYESSFIGLSGTLEQTIQVTKQYAAYFEKQATDTKDYQVFHNDKIFLLDKRGRLRGLYGSNDTNEKLSQDIASLVQAEM